MAIVDTLPQGFRPKQVEGAFRIQRERHVILADQPGAGKTLQMLLAAELDGLFTRRSNILITTTMTACQLTWAGELQRRIASQYDVVIADLTDPHGKKTLPNMAKRDDELATALLAAEDADRPLIVLVNFEGLRWKVGEAPKLATLWEIEWDMVAIDEAHLVLPTQYDKGSQMTQFWYGLAALKYRSEIPMEPTVDDYEYMMTGDMLPTQPFTPIKLPMTGTPDRGKLWNRYGYWKWFAPQQHQNFLGWAQSQFITTWVERGFNPRTGRPNKIPEYGKLRHPDTWHAFDQAHMIRRTKAEMLEGLMLEKLWANDGAVEMPMTFAQRRGYEDYQDELQAREEQLIAEGAESEAQALRLQYALRARQMATCTWKIEEYVDERDGRKHTRGIPIRGGREASNKLDWILEWLEERAYSGEDADPAQGKVVIVSYFAEVLHWLRDELAAEGFHAEVMDGSTITAEKQRIEEQFQRGDLRIVLLSGHLGVSINLDAADDMIFVDMVHDPDRVEQAEDRIHRASRMHYCTYWRLVSVNTIDVATVELVDARYRTTRATYEGMRGVEFARRMLAGARERSVA